MAVNGQYQSPPFGLGGDYASTGAGGSEPVTGLADNASPAVSDPWGASQVQPIGQHGLALSSQVHDGFTGAAYASTGAGEGSAVTPHHPNAGR